MKRIGDRIRTLFSFSQIQTKNPTGRTFIIETRFFTCWTMTSEKCKRVHMQENKSIYLSIYLSIWKPFWRRVYINISIIINQIITSLIKNRLQSNLDYPDFSIIRTCFHGPIFSWILIRCDLKKLKRYKIQLSFQTCVWDTVLICASLWKPLGGGGGTQRIFCREDSAPRSNPLPFYIPFSTKKVPLSYTFYWQMVPLSHTLLFERGPNRVMETPPFSESQKVVTLPLFPAPLPQANYW